MKQASKVLSEFRLAIAVLVVVVTLAGCNHTSAVKTDSEIMEDLLATKYYSENYSGFTANSIEIVKRQTDVENKSDKLYCTLSVINTDESIGGYIDMIVLYELYNEGWVLNNCEVDFDGANGGNYWYPEKGLDLSVDTISNDLLALTGEAYTDIDIYSVKSDLESGEEVYSVTGTSIHTYVTEEIDATLTYSFINSGGYWNVPILETNSYKEDWHLTGDYYRNDANQWHIEFLEDSPEDNMFFKFSYTRDGTENLKVGNEMYDTQLFTLQWLTSTAYGTWGNSNAKYIKDNNFSVIMDGDFSSLQTFKYATYTFNKGNISDCMLFIGKDDIGVSGRSKIPSDLVADTYNQRLILKVWKLIPVT